ncbi:putative teichuronic acid biosynthesis glycosyltransferase TuaG [Weizmannia acidilactici]|uniref:Teichuronic acid biosynthesis glycosyltransferase TuaG n=1 Tax=Weizmannia acidilactici TaxID=2607726 RepID=A0A5J4JBT7_9BACI|nr:glycosyltransferase family 2 protein [Weizmannia acidilactici]GER67490.1 putative teichuronic acid biosynthesis glycosyltransferase TuaG [Weizmannia acidilactici]GER68709.1 putative teichuronic acid biosynthesis glycosyltransferase TuaG [Weizmannia acidilactici]GER74245.1 putative teichuronic acid biosynthesis glycosyltransferase TuaG [Weizmannia acidilactici]
MGEKAPCVSIITPAYNAGSTIEDTIESVIRQTFPDWEMIVVDDGSTDDTVKKLLRLEAEDSRIRVEALQENGGAARARNIALNYAKGRYVAFLDSDDRWKPEKLERQLGFMEKNGHAFTFTGYEMIGRDGNPLNKAVHAPSCVCYTDMLKNSIIGCLTVMIDRGQLGHIQMPNIRTRQDYATWLSILKQGTAAYGLDENLAEYRVGNNASLSSNKWKMAKQNWYVYREMENLGLLAASWCFVHYAANAVRKRIY